MSQFEGNIRHRSKNYSGKKSLRVDLTPMVDLGFLLITFFILSTVLSGPTIATLIMPKDTEVTTQVKKNAALTLLLIRNDSIDYYGDTPKQEFRVSSKFIVHSSNLHPQIFNLEPTFKPQP